MTRVIPTLAQARQAALQGKADEAVPLLRLYADSGDASAAASLAELLAFQGKWGECAEHAGALIARPQSVYAGNVFDDLIRLLARAARETHRWDSVLQLTNAAEQRIEENIARYAPSKQDAERERYRTIFQALRAYVQREGVPPHELIRIFGAAGPIQSEQDAAYRLAVQNVSQLRPDLYDDPVALSRHLFNLARFGSQEDEAIRFYEERNMPADFDCAVFVAKAYVRRGQSELAWKVLWQHMSLWYPLDRAQVAPVVLLVDRSLGEIMTPERCNQVLAMPRGPAKNVGR